MLRQRLIGAAAIILPVIGLLWLDEHLNFDRPGIWFTMLAVAVAGCCVWELSSLLQAQLGGEGAGTGKLNQRVILFATIAAVLIGSAFKFMPNPDPDCPLGNWGWPMLGLATATAIIMLVEMRQFQAGHGATERIARSLMAIFYVVVPYFFIFHLRMSSPNLGGVLKFVSIVFIAKWADAGAYFAGRFLGKHKMAPVLSPKKTIEGGIGGLLAAIVAAIVYVRWMMPWFLSDTSDGSTSGSLLMIAGFGIAVGIAGVIGDLSISLFKRDAGEKDSASLLPGLGGFLDVMDSVLWAAPVGYLFWISNLL